LQKQAQFLDGPFNTILEATEAEVTHGITYPSDRLKPPPEEP
jgi:hypothetical protein